MLERSAFKSCVQYLIDLLGLKKDETDVLRSTIDLIFDQLGQLYFDEIIQGMVHSVPRTYLHLLSDLLYKFVMRYPDKARLWLRQSLAWLRQSLALAPGTPVNPQDPVQQGPKSARDLLLKQAMTTRNIRRFKDVVKEFILQYRGL
jgi:hypothetical protein